MGSMENNESHNGIGIGRITQAKSPNEIRKESFLSWLKDIFCPNFKYTSIIFILTCVDLFTYILTLFFGIKRTPQELLAPTYQTLDLFGMKIPSKIYYGQIINSKSDKLLFFTREEYELFDIKKDSDSIIQEIKERGFCLSSLVHLDTENTKKEKKTQKMII